MQAGEIEKSTGLANAPPSSKPKIFGYLRSVKDLHRILSYLRHYRGLALLNVLFNTGSILFSLFSVVLIIPFLQLLFGKIPPVSSEPAAAFSSAYLIEYFKFFLSSIIRENGQQQALLYICVAVAVIFLLKNVFRFLAVMVLAPIRNGVVRDIRTALYQKILSLPLGFYTKEKKGELITRMTDDVKEVEWSVMSFIEITVREPLTILLNLGFMIFLSPQLTLFVFAMLLITGLIIGRIGKSLKRESTLGQQKSSGLISAIEETLSGIRIIKAFTAEKFRLQQFQAANQEHYTIANRTLSRRELSSPLTEFMAICVVCMVLWFGGNLVLQHRMLEAETFIGFMVIFSQLIPPAKNFSTAFYHIQKGLASSSRIAALLDEPVKITEAPNATPATGFEREIEFRQVSFAYHRIDDKRIIDHFSLTIPKGRMVALVGHSGAGKTTLVDLLPRFYDVAEGAVLIDGTDIRQLQISSLRNLFGIVSQEAFLFNDTIFNNIAFGLENVSQQQVEEAARIANAHDFILKQPQGYHTTIGDRGNRLSGGERQRLTIARAVLRNPPILILDEATSSLDSESEKLVQDALNKLMRGRTTIVIAHRLSTIQYADEIVVMENGRLAERGNHIALMAKQGLYKRLVDLQQF